MITCCLKKIQYQKLFIFPSVKKTENEELELQPWLCQTLLYCRALILAIFSAKQGHSCLWLKYCGILHDFYKTFLFKVVCQYSMKQKAAIMYEFCCQCALCCHWSHDFLLRPASKIIYVEGKPETIRRLCWIKWSQEQSVLNVIQYNSDLFRTLLILWPVIRSLPPT